ncbi:nucleotidyltransferase domain-containing protein [Thiohalophilus thiocyanatoxydans]|uniref:Putative nucleotidyltransferase-like protein n=1 Tax=Thiohalophilus thiocyanatoxydans TaxID=381308 RepID=A0A4R8IT60_9GAMM|nr:nucleotidyltransferase family protein [Thiohalophilus thiocyanatoxydans]TDY03798.1 putative nucleotidyltransferase-like protein [Thiohalophilus thiocyanatoxydans]
MNTRLTTRPLIIQALRDPGLLTQLTPGQWNDLLPQGRQSHLLARLAHLIRSQGRLDALHPSMRNHLRAALVVAARQRRAVHWELTRLQKALATNETPVLLLKGAAYLVADLPAGHGRLFSDIDILVPRAQLAQTESALKAYGWTGDPHLDAYDQRYYRQWMHELPPLRHPVRGSVIDVHHNILPDTARAHPDAARLLVDAVPVAEYPGVYVLAPEDMILHSATHLFWDGEFDHGLRDLVDLDALLRHFAQDAGFWNRLQEHAVHHGLTRPLYYTLRYVRFLLDTPVPDKLYAALNDKPSTPVFAAMDWSLHRALRPMHPSAQLPGDGFARWLLYVRGHFLRMPLHLLVPHLVRKALRKRPIKDR